MARYVLVACVVALGMSGCGDNSAPPGNSGGAGGSAGSGGTGGNGGTGGTDGLVPDASVDAPEADAGPCPDVSGRYSNLMTTGAGCGDINTSAPQCIQGTSTVCFAHFSSVVPGGGTGAVNGGAMLQMDGSFSGASIILGTAQRTGCIGSWNESTSTMTANCGGTGSSQSCTVTMVRTGATCP
jgi:hypothetical protein